MNVTYANLSNCGANLSKSIKMIWGYYGNNIINVLFWRFVNIACNTCLLLCYATGQSEFQTI